MNKKYIGLNTKGLKKKYYQDYQEIMSSLKKEIDEHYLMEIKIGELTYLFDNKLTNIPLCDCGSQLKFKKYSLGYNKYCSRSCSAFYTHKDPNVKEKRVSKMITSNNNIIDKNLMVEKFKKTVNSFSVERKQEINEKRKNTVNLKYGVDNISMLRKLPYYKKIDKRLIQLKNDISMTNEYELISYDKKSNMITVSCNDCKCEKGRFDIDRGLFFRRRLTKIKECVNLNPKNGGSSKYEFELMNILDKNNIKYIHRYRDSKEIDLYLTDYKIGLEFNGMYWHSELYKSNDYHIEKTKYFKNKGIRIIHIWEDEWINDKEKVIDYLFSILNINVKKIYGRKCIIKEVTKKDTSDFLKKNHLQKNINQYTHSIGLYHNKILVSLLVMGGLRKNLGSNKKDNSYEILRFCNLRGYKIFGSFSKLFKNFIKNNKVKYILTYSDASKFNGEVYLKFGFNPLGMTKPNYYYIDPKNSLKKHNRWNFRKDVLVSEGFNENMTEKQIMFNRKYYRIYDVGNYKFELVL